ncbi:deoxyribonuclease IV [Geomesophilobacter sediminis]|uniref:Probable endonuclease 4 n=1 Tax=Geomesophilobacter sediminis TaxID=2798584 RepID=A0A8J7S9N2_9BACT|nr:deoxyribonuclease IV [Geomesophilobacter sediminis]MBJ6726981.1 deoxyribonuclease IV [Geomesophilobacter sediminis]
MALLGAHVSIAGGVYKAPERGAQSGCKVIQVFTQNSNQWKGKFIPDQEAELFQKNMAVFGIAEAISHDIYLINLAAAPGDVRDKSMIALKEEMERCARLGIAKIVMHPGSHNGDGTEVGIRRICEGLDELFYMVPQFTGKILLENTAGQGSNIGSRFEDLKGIIEGCGSPDRFGICFDTCHAFAAGYNIAERDGYEKTFADLDAAVGISRLQAFHLNDTKKGLGSHVDRHDHIGKGVLGIDAFRFLLNDPRFAAVPKIIETPKGDDDEMDRINLQTLRDLIEA